jgi:hypothetical protein
MVVTTARDIINRVAATNGMGLASRTTLPHRAAEAELYGQTVYTGNRNDGSNRKQTVCCNTVRALQQPWLPYVLVRVRSDCQDTFGCFLLRPRGEQNKYIVTCLRTVVQQQ